MAAFEEVVSELGTCYVEEGPRVADLWTSPSVAQGHSCYIPYVTAEAAPAWGVEHFPYDYPVLHVHLWKEEY